MTDLEKEKIKNVLYAWGSYKYIIMAEKRELEDIKLMYRNMTDIKSVCMDTSFKEYKVNASVKRGFNKNIKLCEGRIEKLNKMIKENMESKIIIDEIVDKFSYVEQYILKARYVKNLDWSVIPFNLPFDMSKRHCFRCHNNAIEKIYEELKKKNMLKNFIEKAD